MASRIVIDIEGNNSEQFLALRKRLKIASVVHDETMSVIAARAITRELDRMEGRTENVASGVTAPGALAHQIARRRDYSGPNTQVGTQVPISLWQEIRRVCLAHDVLLRHFIIDALRRHLRLVQRGGSHVGQPQVERRIVT